MRIRAAVGTIDAQPIAPITTHLSVAEAEALSQDLQLLARLHESEADADLILRLKEKPVAEWFALKQTGVGFEEGARLLEAALADIQTPADKATLDDLAAEYAAIYLTYAYRASPYESVWLDEDNLERQAPMFAVRSWFNHYGLQAPDWRKRSEDHIAFELDFLALLLTKCVDPIEIKNAARFLRTHPMVWLPDFSTRVVARCRQPFYAGAAIITVSYLERLMTLFANVFGEDMTIIRPDKMAERSDGPARPTCADGAEPNKKPPQKRPKRDPRDAPYVPGMAPSW